MNDYVIDVDRVSIRFNLASEKVDNLKEYAIKLMKHELMFQEFLALQDVSLKVKKGESWGLIGTNGSGKSTLLKTISGILQPYKGTVTTKGTIAPLIELGAGFDGNLTGRENIYLNGMVLGHSRKFMDEHFDEIVQFANLKKFLDSPIKNFSSGMKARLGFSVATVVNPDILIVDEVLEVGDYNFRRRCQERMQQMLAGGTTLLFVSHNIQTVKNLCDNAIWLDKGVVRMAGPSELVCNAYKEEQDRIAKEKKEEKQEKETSYSVKSNVVQSCLGRYSRDLDLDSRDDTDEFENSLRKKEEELKSGVLEGDKEDALKAKILMMKYVEAEYDGDKDKQALYETALQRYGVDSIKRKPENGGSFVVETKPYGERTEEEKANINAAMEKAFPKKREMDPAVLEAMKEKKGQTLQ